MKHRSTIKKLQKVLGSDKDIIIGVEKLDNGNYVLWNDKTEITQEELDKMEGKILIIEWVEAKPRD